MKKFRIELTERAESHIFQAFDWYFARSAEAADRFITDLDAALERISSFPLANQTVYRHMRRAILSTFPFKVFYQITDETAYILAVLHHSQSESEHLEKTD